MKRLTKYLSILFFLSFVYTGCYRDVITPNAVVDPDGPPMAVSFKADLAPLFNTKCNITGCHVSGAHKPYMGFDISYQQITNGGFVNILVPKQSILYMKVNNEMKEYIPSAVDRQKVYDWIRNGAPNN